MRQLDSIIQEGLNFFHAGDMEKAEFIFDQLLARYPGNSDVMGLLGSLYSKLGKNGAAIAMLSASVENAEKGNPGFWSNLAAVLKRENHMQEAELAFVEGLQLDENNVNTLANFSGLYINAGCPEKAEELARKAIHNFEANTSFINIEGQSEDQVAVNLARHHLSLALLEQDKWEEAWTLYDNRKTTEGWQRPTYDIPLWKGEKTGVLVIHGEQGIGDEIMYCSLVSKAKTLAREVVVETTPRLVPLMRRSLGCDVYPNMESILQAGIKPDHVIAMGSLPGVFRLARKDARKPGYLIPDQARKAYWRSKLDSMAKGKQIIGVAWTGGVAQTHKVIRNPPKELFKTLGDKYFLVSVQYTQNAQNFAAELGAYHHQAAIDDLDEQCALISSLDCLVTVAQTAMHFAGGTNTPCIGLVASKPRWDCIGETEDQMPWWPSVKLLRQKDDWAELFVRLNQELEARYAAPSDIAAE
jgi:Flp pilus assembly protein TadD